jgi:hypothetical protein
MCGKCLQENAAPSQVKKRGIPATENTTARHEG